MSLSASDGDSALNFVWGDRGPTTMHWPVERDINRAATKLFYASPLLAEALHNALEKAITVAFAYHFPKE